MKIRIQLRRDREEYLAYEDSIGAVILKAGEVGVAFPDVPNTDPALVSWLAQNPTATPEQIKARKMDTTVYPLGQAIGMKVGDGVSKWSDLAYFYPFKEIKATNGRTQRDLSGFNTLNNALSGANTKTYKTPWELLDAFMHPFVNASASLSLSKVVSGVTTSINNTYIEMGDKVATARLSLTHSKGTANINKRTLYEITANTSKSAPRSEGSNAIAYSAQQLLTTGTTIPSTPALQHDIANLSAAGTIPARLVSGGSFYREFVGEVMTDTQPTNSHTDSNKVGVNFVYPILSGFRPATSDVSFALDNYDLYTLPNKQVTKFNKGGTPAVAFSENVTSEVLGYFYIAIPVLPTSVIGTDTTKQVATISKITNAGFEVYPTSTTFTEGFKTVTRPATATNDGWTLEYRVIRSTGRISTPGSSSGMTYVVLV
jgi:hypothetical protein